MEALALKPVEIQMDQSQIQQLTNEWKEAENAPLPDEEDEDFKWFEWYIHAVFYFNDNFLPSSAQILNSPF